MLDRVLAFDYTLWIAAFAFYAVDVCVLARGDEILFVESWKRLRPVLARVPFNFRGGDLYWLAPLAPFSAVFKASAPAGSAAALSASTPALADLRKRLWPLRTTSTAIFVLLFIAGPVLTRTHGLGMALLLVLPAAYALNLAGLAVLTLRPPAFGIARRTALSIGFDCLVCIPYAANLVKRVARRLDGTGHADDWMNLGALPEEAEHVRAIRAEREGQA